MKAKANQIYFAAIKLLAGFNLYQIGEKDMYRAIQISQKLARMIPDDEIIQNGNKDLTEEEIYSQKLEETRNIFKDYPWTTVGARWSDLDRYIRNTIGIKSSRRISDYFTMAIEHHILSRDYKKFYHYIGDADESVSDD